MHLDTMQDCRTAAAAADAMLTKLGIQKEDTKDILVLLGMPGATLLHQSAGKCVIRSSATAAELHEAFAMVRPKTDWKKRISKVLRHPGEDKLGLIVESIAYMGCGKAEVFTMPAGKIRITAPGHYKTAGA
jgi:hypothetical protein